MPSPYATSSEPQRDSHARTSRGTIGPPELLYQGRSLELNPIFTNGAEPEHLAPTNMSQYFGQSFPLNINAYDDTWNPQRLAGGFSSVAPSRADNFRQSQYDARFHKTWRATRNADSMDLSQDTPEDAIQDRCFQIADEGTNHKGSNIDLPGQEQRDPSIGQAQQTEWLVGRDDVEANSKKQWGRAPLWLPPAAGQEAFVKSLVGPDISVVNGVASHPYSPSRRALKEMAHTDYTVGWICALPTELAVAVAMLDEHHVTLPRDSHDINNYNLGRIGGHNVAIACLPFGVTGTTSAATAASYIRSTFPSIVFGLMVGVGGGAPSATNDIRLGDVVVSRPDGMSGGIIHYDFEKTVQEGRLVRTGSLNRPPDMLLNAVSSLQARHMLEEAELPRHLSQMLSKYPKMKGVGTYQGEQHDQLFKAEYNHRAGADTCSDCDPLQVVSRSIRSDSVPVIHYGLIASGNQVMRDGATRERLRKELNVLCFEMEAAGLMDNFPCLVIRGICGYADTHKNKRWQPYAAAVAAAYAKELLCVIPANQVIRTRTIIETGIKEGEYIHLASVRGGERTLSPPNCFHFVHKIY